MMASFKEYERSKFRRRFRRGKEARSQQGFVIGSDWVPYGYRYVTGEKRFEVVEAEITFVPLLYQWLVEEGLSLEAISRRLDSIGAPTKKGAKHWSRQTVVSILRNPIYKGTWYWNKTKRALNHTQRDRSPEEWIEVPTASITRGV
jgi:site-specific DNA recombinase